jgi:hypothetical protein
MSRTILVMAPYRLRFKGLFDFQELYRFLRDEIRKRRYEFHEKLYKDKKSNPVGSEVELKLVGEKRVTAYYKHHLYIFVHTWDFHEVDVVRDGEKKKLADSRVYIIMEGRVEVDWQNKFEGKYSKIMGDILFRIQKREREHLHVDVLEDEIRVIFAATKKFLNMETQSLAM